MENQIRLDCVLLLYSVGFGLVIGLYYEFFRFLRAAFRHNDLMVAVEDIVFFLSFTVFFLLFEFVFSDGIIRWFSVAGMLIGFTLYQKTLGRLIRSLYSKILGLLRMFLRFLRRIIIDPITNVFKKITNYLYSKVHFIAIIRKEKKKKKKLERQIRRFLNTAERGFFI